jgi:predicted nucleic acid-binding Zn ribbon protein
MSYIQLWLQKEQRWTSPLWVPDFTHVVFEEKHRCFTCSKEIPEEEEYCCPECDPRIWWCRNCGALIPEGTIPECCDKCRKATDGQ